MTNINLSYSQKLLLLVLTLSLVPLISLSIILYVDKIDTETNSLKNHLTTISETGSKNISDWITERKSNVFAIAQDKNIVSSTKKLSDLNIKTEEYFDIHFELQTELGIFLENFQDLQSFTISNAETGKVLFYTDLVPPSNELKNQRHFLQAAKGNIELSEVFLSTKAIPNEFGNYETSIPTFFISSPIQGEEGIEGVLTARVNLFQINLIKQLSFDFNTEDSYLINSEGYFLSKPRLLGEAINSGLIEKRPELNLQVINPDSNQFTEIFQSANNENTEHNLNGYTNYLGNTVIGSISPVKDTNWNYITEIEKKEAFLGISIIQNLIFLVISLVLLIIIGVSFHFASGLTMPIKKLQDAAEQIMKGNLEIKTLVDSKDEIGDLARSFEYMVVYLKKTTDIEVQLALQQNLRKALDESSIVSIFDKNGKITFVNDKFCKVSKYSKEELIGKPQSILRSGIHPPAFYADLWNEISSGNVWHGEICNLAKDNTLFWNETTIVPFSDKDGKIYEYAAVRNDITEQKNLTKKLVNSERLSAIGELSARISHDIRNPLSVLSNELELLKYKKLLDENQTRRMDNSITRITHQIDEVLEFVRETPLRLSKFNFNDLVNQSMESLTIPSKIKISISKDQIFMIGDERKMEVVLINLILNSIQAIDDSGTIEIILSETNTGIILKVIDSGHGIKTEPIDKVFDPLITSKQRGTGLGLASVKNIVEQHDGIISVKNNPTTFTVEIPKRDVK